MATNQNLGGYQGTGQYGTFDGVTYNPPDENNLYGSATTAAGTTPNQLIVTGAPATSQFNTYSNDLDNMLNDLNTASVPGATPTKTPTLENTTNDPYIQALDKVAATSSASTKALIGSIQASYTNQKNQIDTQYDDYKRGLQLLGIEHNAAQATPDLLMGHIQQASNEQQAKLQSLSVEINKALMDAESAQAQNDLSTLKEKMDYVDKLKQEQNDYLKNIAKNLNAEASIAKTEAGQFYDAIQKLDPADQESFILELAKKYSISPTSIVKALADEKTRRESGSSGSSKILSTSDIQRINDLYGIVLPYGTTEAEAEKLLNDQGVTDTSATTGTYTQDYLSSNYSTGELYDMALKAGIEHKVNQTRQDEINKLYTYIDALYAEGYTDKEIADLLGL